MENKKIKVKTSEVIGKITSDYVQILDDFNNRRIFLQLSQAEFKELFLLNTKLLLTKKGQMIDFEVDDFNKEVINQLYFYLIGDAEKFTGDLQKGIFLVGDLGTGKTLIMTAFLNLIEYSSNKIITKLHSKALANYLREKGEDFLNLRPLFIDDIGKEAKIVNDFGTIKNPIPDLFSLRYDFGSWTFATCNYNIEDLTEFYGKTILDRFKEMFNYLTLTGDSRRK